MNYLRDKPVTLVFRLPHRLDPFLDLVTAPEVYVADFTTKRKSRRRLLLKPKNVLSRNLHTCFPDDDASGEDDMSRHAVKPLAILGAYRATAVAVECFLKPKRSRSDGAERQV